MRHLIAPLLRHLLLALVLLPGLPVLAADTIRVTAEGLADPNAEAYQRDQGIMLDDLRQDARRQVIEKAVGSFIDSNTLVENYVLLEDRVFSKSTGLIKRVIKESDPWLGEDGFMHLLLQAEVYVTGVEEALQEMSRSSRVGYIRQYGDPKISVAIFAQDVERGSWESRSEIAENILKEHISAFGYRVWSEEMSKKLKAEMMESSTMDDQVEATISVSHLKEADFSIYGKVKFDVRTLTLKASGVSVKKHVITSWTVKCVDNHTGEEIYFNNQIPRRHSWATEDEAVQDVGRLIGAEFSKDFFQQHLMSPSKIYQLRVIGLPSYDVGVLLKKELIGLRPILRVDFRNYTTDGISVYEVDFAGNTGNFAELLNSVVIKPLNAKFGERAFNLDAVEQGIVKVSFQGNQNIDRLLAEFNAKPPASLASATPERLRHIARNEQTLTKLEQLNPGAVAVLRTGETVGSAPFQQVKDF
jgi:serine/threonine-protein kinase